MREDIYREVLSYVNDDEVIELTQALVRIPSVYREGDPEGNEEKVAKFVYDKLSEIGMDVEMKEVVSHRPNVRGILKGKGPGRRLLFSGHTDVVTEGDSKKWTYPPFSATIVGDKMYGRGANDMKGGLAAAIIAIKAIIESGVEFPGEIVLGATVDEEGMMIGIKDFIKSGWADGVDGAIICEPEENNLCITQKGAMRVIAHTYGKMAHGAMPLTGINPIPRMARFIDKIMELEASEIQKHGEDRYLGFPSLTPTIVKAPPKGEAQINVMPDEAMMALDIRTIPGQEHEDIKRSITNIIDELKKEDNKFKGDFEVIEERPWTKTDLDAPIVKSLDFAYRFVTGKEPIYNGVPGATDGTFLWAWKNIPIVTIGPGNRLIPHHIDEYLDIPELLESVRIYIVAALHFLGI